MGCGSSSASAQDSENNTTQEETQPPANNAGAEAKQPAVKTAEKKEPPQEKKEPPQVKKEPPQEKKEPPQVKKEPPQEKKETQKSTGQFVEDCVQKHNQLRLVNNKYEPFCEKTNIVESAQSIDPYQPKHASQANPAGLYYLYSPKKEYIGMD